MSLHFDRLKDSLRIIASEEIQSRTQLQEHPYGIVTIMDILQSKDRAFIDIVVSSEYSIETLPKYLAPIAPRIHSRISREIGLRKTPRIRFRKLDSTKSSSQDISALIHELDLQYGLSQKD